MFHTDLVKNGTQKDSFCMSHCYVTVLVTKTHNFVRAFIRGYNKQMKSSFLPADGLITA